MKFDINLKVTEHKKFDGDSENGLKLLFSGKHVNPVLVNSIRRTILSYIPVFSYHPSLINIKENESIFDNDILCSNISLIPVLKIENKQIDIVENINDDELQHLTMYCKQQNTENNIKHITTDDCTFYYKDELIKNPYPSPFLITHLKQNERIEFSAKTKIGHQYEHAIYTCANCVHYYDTEDKVTLCIESTGQLDEKDIFYRGCEILKKKIEQLKEQYNKSKIKQTMSGSIVFNKETHTTGNLISYYMKDHPNIKFCGYKIPHMLVDLVEIEYVINGSKKIKEIFNEVLDNIIKLLEHLIKQKI